MWLRSRRKSSHFLTKPLMNNRAGKRLLSMATVLADAAQKVAADASERTVKVVATMGSAWDSAEMIQKMILAGVNIVRLNCSHRFINGKKGEFERIAPLIRAAAAAAGKHVEILGDLQVLAPMHIVLRCSHAHGAPSCAAIV